MQNMIRKILVFSLVLSIGVVSTVHLNSLCKDVHACKNEESLKLSLFHLDIMTRRYGFDCPSLSHVCKVFSYDASNWCGGADVKKMVNELLDIHKELNHFEYRNDVQNLNIGFNSFFKRCAQSKLHAIVSQKGVSCLSNLVVNALESCDVHVAGDLIVDGQIINDFCQGSGPFGPPGPPGPAGSQGPPGQPAVDLTGDNYLYASLLTSSESFFLTNDLEDTVPVSAVFSSGWTEVMGSSGIAFECPVDGLYQVSYEFSPELLIVGSTLYSVSAWLRIINGGMPVELVGSREILAKVYSPQILFTNFVTQLSNTFCASLSAGDLVEFRFGNTAALGVSAAAVSLPSGTDFNGTTANLVITRIS